MSTKSYYCPGTRCDQFLAAVGPRFEVIVFTASLAKYADPLLDLLDKARVVRWRLFREACCPFEGNYVKDLLCLGRPLADSIIVDNSPHSCAAWALSVTSPLDAMSLAVRMLVGIASSASSHSPHSCAPLLLGLHHARRSFTLGAIAKAFENVEPADMCILLGRSDTAGDGQGLLWLHVLSGVGCAGTSSSRTMRCPSARSLTTWRTASSWTSCLSCSRWRRSPTCGRCAPCRTVSRSTPDSITLLTDGFARLAGFVFGAGTYSVDSNRMLYFTLMKGAPPELNKV